MGLDFLGSSWEKELSKLNIATAFQIAELSTGLEKYVDSSLPFKQVTQILLARGKNCFFPVFILLVSGLPGGK